MKKPKNKLNNIQIPENLIHILAVLSFLPACLYQVRLVNIFGDTGSACYFVAFDWFFLLFGLTGLGVFRAVSDMVFSRLERGNVRSAVRVVRSAVWKGIGVSVPVCVLGYIAAGFLMRNVMHLPLAALAMKGFLPGLVMLCAMTALCGGMDGFGNSKGTDTVQLVFCLVLFLAGPVFTVPLYEYGEKVGALLQNERYGPAYGAQGGAFVWLLVAEAGLAVALFCWWSARREIKKMENFQDAFPPEKERQIFRSILVKSLLFALPFLLACLAMIGQALMFIRVQEGKEAADWMQQWGIYAGKVRPLLMIPVILAAGYGMHMLPDLKTAYLRRNLKRSRERCMVSMRCIALMMVPATVLFAVMGEPVSRLLYQKGEMDLTVQLLRIGSISMIFFGLAAMLAVILLSMNMTVNFIIGTVLSAVLHFAALYGMLGLMDLGIFGVIYANLILSFLLCCCYFFEVRRQVRLRVSWIRIFLAPCIGGAVMAAVCALISLLILKEAPAFVNVLVGTVTGLIAYFAVVLVLKGVSERELKSYPGGESLIWLARLFRLM